MSSPLPRTLVSAVLAAHAVVYLGAYTFARFNVADVPFVLVGGLLAFTLALLINIARSAERRSGRGAGAIVATVTLASAASLCLICASVLREPLTSGMLLPPKHFLLKNLAAVLASALVGIVVAVASRRLFETRGALVARVAALVSLVVLVALVGVAVAWSSRAQSPERFIASLQVFARLPPQTHRRDHRERSTPTSCRDTIPFGDVSLVRDCAAACGSLMSTCALSLERRAVPGATTTHFGEVSAVASTRVHNDAELLVLLDDARDLLVIRDGTTSAAFDMRALRPVVLSAYTIRPGLAAPRSWIFAGIVGALSALALLLIARRRPPAEPAAATLRDDGVLLLDGRALTGIAVPPGVTAGPVLVFLARHLGATHYRDDAPQRGARVEAGTLADHHARVASRASMWAMLACCAAAFAGAPLVAWAHAAVVASTTKPLAPTQPSRVLREGVEIEELVVGRGEEIANGRQAVVHYTGRLTNGAVFDSSRDRDPFEFPFGAGRVIPGFEIGLRGMRVGGRRVITIPPALGYGSREVHGNIPADSTLVFDLELIGLR